MTAHPRLGRPEPFGLFDPDRVHDACGVGFVVDMHGRRSRRIVEQGLECLANLAHRGAQGAEPDTGDGAGILLQVPDRFCREVAGEAGIDLPLAGRYVTGMAFLPQGATEAEAAKRAVEAICAEEGGEVLGWREVPHDASQVGPSAKRVMPRFAQVFATFPAPAGGLHGGLDAERRAFVVRKRAEHAVDGLYFASLSARTMVYKGMLTTPQLGAFFADLGDERLDSALALVHSRFSTNTFPAWPLAHPYRFLAHNGEINTLQGNRNAMRAREAMARSPLFEGDLGRTFPVLTPRASDSASFDEMLEFLHLGGRSLPHAVLMMIPEAWERHESMPDWKRDFYRFHACVMEPWDGPASIAFTDGTVIGAVLDRNGLRPSRYWVTDDGLVVMASEAGVVDLDPARVVLKGRLQPGRMFLVDTEQGRIVDDDEIKKELAAAAPYGTWLERSLVAVDGVTRRRVRRDGAPEPAPQAHQRDLRTFGYTLEDLKVLIGPMARTGVEPIGSMGHDAPLAVLSNRSRLLFDYFHQLFAQVTNPPLDAIREELVTALSTVIGPEGNILDPGEASCRRLELSWPVLDAATLATLVHGSDDGDLPGFPAEVLPALYPVAAGGEGLRRALDDLCAAAGRAVDRGTALVVLSDRGATAELAPIPSLLATAAVHHHLIRTRQRTRIGLVVEAGDAREVHHAALLLGYGAAAVHPWLACEVVEDLARRGTLGDTTPEAAVAAYRKAAGKGVLKIMSKMGISTVASYTGAQVFEAIGLGSEVVDAYFTGTVSRIGGVGLDEIAAEVARRHATAFTDRPAELAHRTLDVGGDYRWRREGEYHQINPETVSYLQRATRTGDYGLFKRYSRICDEQARHLSTLRGLFTLRTEGRTPIPVEDVESVDDIVKRFSTGAMSYGSISAEAHETLAIAMNRLGGRSNTGEGGEDPRRFVPDPNGDLRRSAVKQVASGRFGVTSEYLVNADDLQIKMAQGAKPGEGGQLPGHKVWPWIARTRHSTPGVGLISPPPHHDIYSIEDLAQLIHDLKNANPRARVHVKLVAEVGVGTVAAGVSKAHADVVLISGHDGGTGASPLSSIKHAGAPWELGLAETQQTLVANNLRDRIVVQVDGQLKTGRDVVVAALLGAEEYGFSTAPLVTLGCIMMRVCHLDTCPAGIATQNPELRKRFSGKPEYVERFFRYVAQEVRELLASLGLRTLEEAIGRADLLDTVGAVDHWKAHGLDLAPLLATPEPAPGSTLFRSRTQDHGLDKALDTRLIELCAPALDDGTPVSLELPIRNVNRTVGTMLGSELTRRWGGEGLLDDTIEIQFRGSAGQSFGAFVPRGITLRLEGDANDYLGKGLSGGRLIVYPDRDAPFRASDNIIAGNVALYGATGGEVFLSGLVGERFCVRNSGATAVVEGVGDHGCEYMTGGRAVVLGPTGRNFAAGMSGGVAYVWDPAGTFGERLNPEMVDLEPLDDEDRAFLSEVVLRHAKETGSQRAEELLGRWNDTLSEFRKVMPRDYRRVLTVLAEAGAEGLSEEAAVERVMVASRG